MNRVMQTNGELQTYVLLGPPQNDSCLEDEGKGQSERYIPFVFSCQCLLALLILFGRCFKQCLSVQSIFTELGRGGCLRD